MEATKHLIDMRKTRLKSTQIFLIAATLLLTLFITVLCIGFMVRYEVDSDVSNIESISYWNVKLPTEQQIWFDRGIDELNRALSKSVQKTRPQTVIIFVASGISSEALAAARFLESPHSAQTALSWDSFPHLGKLKNSCSKWDICDPYSVATALLGGVRANMRVGGLDASVNFRNCSAAANGSHHVKSIFEQAHQIGLRTGFVTKKRVTGPIAAALYAHTPDTSWECDTTMPKGPLTKYCKDIATQLIESESGNKINVLMGGGRQTLVSSVPVKDWDPIDDDVCNSDDGRNFLRDWQTKKLMQRQSFDVVQDVNELTEINGKIVDNILGIFSNSDLDRPVLNEKRARNSIPKLGIMVKKSIEILRRRNSPGFILLVETGARVDANVSEQTRVLLELNAVIEETLNSTSSSISRALVLTLFTKGYYVKHPVDTSTETELNLNMEDFTNDDVLVEERLKNIVSDTMIYAKGPRSYLFHGIHEETYMAHVISYALKMGVFNDKLAKKS